MLKKLLEIEIIRFILVGLFNTFMGVVTMFAFYHWLHLGYWGASGLSYFVCSIISFFLNRSFTFRSDAHWFQAACKFAANIAVCYFAAYLVAKPAVVAVLSALKWQIEATITEQVAMLVGMIFFTAFNYLGQKQLVFRKEA